MKGNENEGNTNKQTLVLFVIWITLKSIINLI